jgi:hypothetical protein
MASIGGFATNNLVAPGNRVLEREPRFAGSFQVCDEFAREAAIIGSHFVAKSDRLLE